MDAIPKGLRSRAQGAKQPWGTSAQFNQPQRGCAWYRYDRKMPQSLASVYLHAVFSTKSRYPFLDDREHRLRVHAYIAEVSNRLDCPAIEVGGVGDHVHILARFSRTTKIADWIRETKRVSSGFVKETIPSFSWQAGYGVFSVDPNRAVLIVEYIRSQEEHHRHLGFQDEFRRLMREHDLTWDERYVWD